MKGKSHIFSLHIPIENANSHEGICIKQVISMCKMLRKNGGRKREDVADLKSAEEVKKL